LLVRELSLKAFGSGGLASVALLGTTPARDAALSNWQECLLIYLTRRCNVKTFAILIVLLVVALVGLGFWRGWFDVGSKKEDGKVHADLNLNVNKLKADKDAFKKLLGEKSKALKDKLASLKSKSRELVGEAKAKAEKEIEALTQKHESMEKKMTEVEESTEEKFTALKSSLKGELEEGTAEGKEKEGGTPK
jgi:hypothetical protein